MYNYNIKVTTTSRKSVHYIKPLSHNAFSTLNELKKCIQEIGAIYYEIIKDERLEIRDDDLSKVLLWCYDGNVGEQSTVQTAGDPASSSSKRQAIVKKVERSMVLLFQWKS